MTEAEVFTTLAEAFGLDDVLARYRPLEALEGLKEAIGYWDWSKGMQEGANAGAAWWEYENHKTLAYVLMGVYCWRLLGHDDFPHLPDADPDVLRDRHALLCLWSRSLILDHVHRWQTCHHVAARNRSSHPRCKMAGQQTSEGLSHTICGVCGEERFDPQPMVDRANSMLRERQSRRPG
ncbi:MAG: hypothetical protein A2Y61_06970 [Chloroflexi bacterium RBG_13_60_13]|nr:MAG: hypothetical protein A2Y61_06970 [Chloroflexi bacterium RBG_13_60_13]